VQVRCITQNQTQLSMLLFQSSTSILGSALQQFISSLPKVAGAVIVLFIGWVIAKVVARLLKSVLVKSGVDKLTEKLNSIEIVNNLNLKIVPSSVLATLAYYLLMLIFLMASTDVLGMPAVSNLVSDFINYLPRLLSAMVFFAFGLFISDLIKNMVLTACNSLGIPSAKVISTFLFYFLLIMVAISALEQAQMNTDFIKSNMTLILGGIVVAFGVGYGYASKDVLANFLSSIYTKGRFDLGDVVQIGNIKGTIIEMDSTSVTIHDGDKRTILPMSRFSSDEVIIFDKEE
jgi:small-conductance mechanosensitive channel